jgi:hypothetical protein
MMERRVGKQEPDQWAVGGHIRRHGTPHPSWHQHDRPLDRRQQALVRLGEHRDGARGAEIFNHHGEWLGIAVLTIPKSPHGLLRRCVAREMESAEALQGDHASQPERGRHDGDRILAVLHRSIRRHDHQRGTAGRTGVGLGVKASVLHACVFLAAGGTHRKRRHRGSSSVVRHVTGNREARSTIRAVRERILVTAVARVENLAEAGGAGGQVRRDGNLPIRRLYARIDRERVNPFWWDRPGPQLVDFGCGWWSAGEPLDEIVQCLRRTERVNRHARRVVADASSHAPLGCETPDPGAKADALDHAAYLDSPTEHGHRLSPSDRTYAVRSHASCSLRLGHAGMAVPLIPSRTAKNTRLGDVD